MFVMQCLLRIMLVMTFFAHRNFDEWTVQDVIDSDHWHHILIRVVSNLVIVINFNVIWFIQYHDNRSWYWHTNQGGDNLDLLCAAVQLRHW